MKNKTFVIHSLGSFVIGIVLSLILLEMILRLSGVAYYWFYQPQPNRDLDLDADAFRIMCVGESTTFGVGTPDPANDGYPKQLENMLAARLPDRKFICFYDQAIGINSSEILLKLPVYIEKYRPHLVILMAGVNNWWNLNHSNALLFNTNSSVATFFLRIAMWLDDLRTWKLFKLLALRLHLIQPRWNLEPQLSQDLDKDGYLIKTKNRSITHTLKLVLDHDINAMIDECQRTGVKVILCSYPAGIYFPSHYERWDAMFENIAAAQSIPFVDNYATFQALPNRMDYMFDAACHPNKKGYALVAENVFRAIIDNNLVS
jgi:lysophospholipase L1-like esterase